MAPFFDHRHKKGENAPILTIVIPILNAAESLKAALSTLSQNKWRVIVADGGSLDDTLKIARNGGACVIESPRGRGAQLHAGAQAATSEWLLFLHADTHLSDNAAEVIDRFIADPGNRERAGYFRFVLDVESTKAQRLERRVAWRCKKFALPYGDQGFLISRHFYNRLGGYKNIPLMEDVDLVWRIERLFGRKSLVLLDADARTSAEKFQHEGYFRRSARNLFCLFLFWIKVPPRLIVKVY